MKKRMKKIEQDIEFSRRTLEALKRSEKGKFKKMSFDDFLEEIKKW